MHENKLEQCNQHIVMRDIVGSNAAHTPQCTMYNVHIVFMECARLAIHTFGNFLYNYVYMYIVTSTCTCTCMCVYTVIGNITILGNVYMYNYTL